MSKKILYIDLDNTLVDFGAHLQGIDEGVLEQYRRMVEGKAEPETWYDEIPGVFALMPAMPGAIDAYRTLAELFDTYILSTAPWENPSAWQHKVEWVHLHLGRAARTPAHKRLILSHHKNLNKGHFLVDDRPNNGAKEAGEVPGQQWLEFGKAPYQDWDAVTKQLLPLA